MITDLGAVKKQLLQIAFKTDLSGFQNLIGLYKIVKSLLTSLFLYSSLGITIFELVEKYFVGINVKNAWHLSQK